MDTMTTTDTMDFNRIWAIVLAAGRGSRMNSQDTNKVALPLAGKPIILHTVENLKKAGINHIVVVVGFAKESVIKCLDESITIAEQKEQLGTGHAVQVAIKKIPSTQCVFVLNGDDSYVFDASILHELYRKHIESGASVSLLTLMTDNPTGLGRVIRNENGKILGIVEEKDANEEQRNIKEINPACYLFDYQFLKEKLELVERSEVTGEFYITRLIDIAVQENEKVSTHTVEGLQWRGINTPAELDQANQMIQGK